MDVPKSEVIGLFEELYDLSVQAKSLTADISDRITGFAEYANMSKKALRSAYTAYKSFRSGTMSSADPDYYELMGLVEEHFSEDE